MAAKDSKGKGLQLRTTILEILHRRDPGKTCCPSEAARRVSPSNWQELMEPTRDAARQLRKEGLLDICQKGEVVGDTWTGPIRLRLRSTTPSTNSKTQLTLDSMFRAGNGQSNVNATSESGDRSTKKEQGENDGHLVKTETGEEGLTVHTSRKRKAGKSAPELDNLETGKKKISDNEKPVLKGM